MRGRAAVSAARRVDLPAFGSPTSPTSAISLSSSSIRRCWPGSPISPIRGAWRTEVAKRAFPRPPRPARATTNRSPSMARSASTRSSSASRTTVPTGTVSTRSAPSRPDFSAPAPALPLSARKRRRSRKALRVLAWTSATRTTSPPRPPSPPSGPPLGMKRSRRKLTAPRPPSPAATSRTTSSRNRSVRGRRGLGVHLDAADAEHRQLEHVDPGAIAPGLVECHRPRAQRVEGVIAADADVLAGEDAGAALADDDGPGEHHLAGVALEAEPAPGAVAPVARAATALLVGHDLDLLEAGVAGLVIRSLGLGRLRGLRLHRLGGGRLRGAPLLRRLHLGSGGGLDRGEGGQRLPGGEQRLDPQLGVAAAVAVGAPVALLRLVLEDPQLAAEAVADDHRGDARPFGAGGASMLIGAVSVSMVTVPLASVICTVTV